MSRPLFWGAVISALVAMLIAAPAAQAKRPRVVFDKTEQYYRDVKEGSTLVTHYTFKNKGTLNLIIDRVTPSCGCTASKFTRVTEPGQSGEVVLELDTTGLRGSFHKTAVVATNDPSMPFVTLVIYGHTRSRIMIDKGRRIKLSGCLGTDISTTATLTDPRGKKFFIAGVENPMRDYLDAKLKRMPGGKSFVLTLRSKAKEAIDFAGPVYLRVAGESKVSVYVVANIKGAFKVQPHEVYFGAIGQGLNPPTRAVLVKRSCIPHLTLDKLMLNREHFMVAISWVKPGEEFLVELTPRLDYLPKGPFNEGLAIIASGEKFVVRLSGVVH